MSATASIWLVIVLAAIGANLPFFSQRWLLVGPKAAPTKPMAARLGEMALLYFLVGGVALLLERRVGQIAPQQWEFYAITATLFITLAFPGFIYRYLLRRNKG
ncbi:MULTISPECIES: DUF2818 family protein [unclassified Acidovorax]|uniref:DUF2818 family protein n=1 Tax=unclassified Acidovorax TaxID=2684926 RepID=UPI0023DE6443|nr:MULTISPECIES: DUF2818 family protein [unclassified Acidovorax]GKS94235.1 DUF2818 family protein [Acidovorax sp. SUPP2825]GKT00058.1 DUF2818 family protein [Acidovorax sp. SUPP3434]